MYFILWTENENRLPNEPVALFDPANQIIRETMHPGKTHEYALKDSDLGYLKKAYVYLKEFERGVFQLDIYSFDITHNRGHEGISLKLGKYGDRIDLKGEFTGLQYECKISSGIYDIEGVNRIFWDRFSGYNEFTLSTVSPMNAAENLLNMLNAEKVI